MEVWSGGQECRRGGAASGRSAEQRAERRQSHVVGETRDLQSGTANANADGLCALRSALCALRSALCCISRTLQRSRDVHQKCIQQLDKEQKLMKMQLKNNVAEHLKGTRKTVDGHSTRTFEIAAIPIQASLSVSS